MWNGLRPGANGGGSWQYSKTRGSVFIRSRSWRECMAIPRSLRGPDVRMLSQEDVPRAPPDRSAPSRFRRARPDGRPPPGGAPPRGLPQGARVRGRLLGGRSSEAATVHDDLRLLVGQDVTGRL